MAAQMNMSLRIIQSVSSLVLPKNGDQEEKLFLARNVGYECRNHPLWSVVVFGVKKDQRAVQRLLDTGVGAKLLSLSF